MNKNLVIVESPAKAKTIEKFLGKDYKVLSSQGHIRDIEGNGRKNYGIDFEHGYAPHYAIDSSKKRLVETLRQEATKADMVWLASDEDREGEAIAWHLKEVLNLNNERTRRIAFHEITKSAIIDAIDHPRDIDYNLVNAQQARRVLDRIVGFELSPVLWKKVTTGLSAGRVQSVAVRLVVEREREIEQFKPQDAFKVSAKLTSMDNGAHLLTVELNHRFSTEQEAQQFLEHCAKQEHFTVKTVQKKPAHRSPAPPFTTSLLQQEAARKLHFPVTKTMRIAQTLYEAGHITYMRTDSVNLSSLAINTAREQIIKTYGEQYHHARQYHTTSKGAQEAHEAIRPTYISHETAGSNTDEQRLYHLIYTRTLASQMADAQIEQTRIEIPVSGTTYTFVATGEVTTFDGFMRAYTAATDEDEEQTVNTTIQRLPLLREGQELRLTGAQAKQTFTTPPARYNEASLVKKMEELEIGRPSTYATIIETIQARGYVLRGNISARKRKVISLELSSDAKHPDMLTLKRTAPMENFGAESQRLLPTDLGKVTNDFLVEQFPTILSYDFTANEEKNFDLIAAGQEDWVTVVDKFYKTFHPLITEVPSGKIAGRVLGNDPATGFPVMARLTRNGPCIQIGSAEDGTPRFASLKKEQSIFSITLEEALQLFEKTLPISLGEVDGQEVVVANGKYGPYVRQGDTFASLPKNADPYSITLDEAIQLIQKKRQIALPIHDWGETQVLHGRYGAYIKHHGKNYRIPKSIDAEALTLEQALKYCKES